MISPFKAQSQRLVQTCQNLSLFHFVSFIFKNVIMFTESRVTNMPSFKGTVALETECDFKETGTK